MLFVDVWGCPVPFGSCTRHTLVVPGLHVQMDQGEALLASKTQTRMLPEKENETATKGKNEKGCAAGKFKLWTFLEGLGMRSNSSSKIRW
jgi:hypothetical protein